MPVSLTNQCVTRSFGGDRNLILVKGDLVTFSYTIRKNMQDTAEYICAFCGESNSTFVDFSAGLTQSYVEDCQVCCQPNVLYVQIDEEILDIEISSEPES